MFNYAVVFTDNNDVEIHKCESMSEVEDIIIDKLRADWADDVIDGYIDYIKSDVECDWYTEPRCVVDYVKDVLIDDHCALADYNIYWE